MKRVMLSIGLLSCVAASAVIQVDTNVVHNGQEDKQVQTWYVGDHIIRRCGDVELDGTIREIYGDVVTIHCKIKRGNAILQEEDMKISWQQEGSLSSSHANAEFKIKLTDLKDQHPKK
jgi:hypothetical protein